MSQLIHFPSVFLWWNAFYLFIFIRICAKALMRSGIRWNKMIRTGELSDLVLSNGPLKTFGPIKKALTALSSDLSRTCVLDK